MFSQSRVRFLGLVAGAGILVALSTAPASADEQVSRLGPVGPHETVLSSVGEKRIVAFYAKNAGHCAVQMAVLYTHFRAHETGRNLVCRLLLEKKKYISPQSINPSLFIFPSLFVIIFYSFSSP